MAASFKGHVDIIRLLIEAKAQLNSCKKEVFCKSTFVERKLGEMARMKL